MKRLLASLLIGFCFLGFGIWAMAAETPSAGKSEGGPAGEPAENHGPLDFKLTRLDGKEVFAKHEFGGKPAIIMISQSACGNCQQELALLGKMYDSIKSKTYVAVVMVDMDGNGERLTKFLADYNVKFPAFKDPQFQFGRRFGINFTPATIFLDKDGSLVDQVRGFDAGADKELLAKIKTLVK